MSQGTKILLIIILAALVVALILVFGRDLFNRAPRSPLPPDFKPAIYEEEQVSYQSIKKFLPAGIFVDEKNVKSATASVNPLSGEEQYAVTFTNIGPVEVLLQLYDAFAAKNGFTERMTNPGEISTFLAYSADRTKSLNIAIQKMSRVGTEVTVNLVYSVRK